MLRVLLIASLLVGGCRLSLAAPTEVIYPSDDFRYAEYIATLRAALDKTTLQYGPYVLHPARIPMDEPRFLLEARSGKRVNVIWSATSKERESSLRAIRIPLSKGALGYRILLIKRGTQSTFDGVRSIEDLRRFTFGLGPGWGDIAIYRAAGLRVDIAPYQNLFEMLSAGRFDVYSRGLNEAFGELEVFGKQYPDITFEQHLLLHYTYPFYFFVAPTQPRLAERIEVGLRTMIRDGTLDALFMKFNGSAIARARLDRRTLIEMPNPAMPSSTPLSDASLWYHPTIAP
jgi:hypothetical protein